MAELQSSTSSPVTPPRELRFDSVVSSVRKINTVEETFEVALRVFVLWSALSGDTWEPVFGETFLLLNAADDPRIVDTSPVEWRDTADGRFASKNWLIRVVIDGHFDLRSFPFDEQLLTVKFRIPRVNKQGFRAILDGYGSVEHSNTSMELDHAWRLVRSFSGVIATEPTKANYKPEYHVSVLLKRRPYLHIVNVGLHNALLICLSFSIFALQPDAMLDRLTIISGVLFATLALKFSVGSLLPVLDYDTLLDSHTLAMLFMLYGFGFESMLVATAFDNADDALVYDRFFLRLFVSLFLCIHARVAWLYIRFEAMAELTAAPRLATLNSSLRPSRESAFTASETSRYFSGSRMFVVVEGKRACQT